MVLKQRKGAFENASTLKGGMTETKDEELLVQNQNDLINKSKAS